MNSKMTTHSQLSITEPNKKQKQTKQTRKRKRIIDMEIIWRVISGEREEREWEKMNWD